jgi:PhnB protein
MPHAMPLSDEDGNKIMHIALPIGKGNVLMGTDYLESMGHKMIEGNRYSISVSAQSKEEAEKLFNGLSVGGKIEVPIADSPWGSYFGMFSDRFGIKWMVDFDPK